MVFSKKHRNIADFNFRLQGLPIEEKNHERFLGVILDRNLSWTHHITKLASKISRNAGILYKLKGIVPQKVIKTLYNSFIQSHLNYCSNVWGLGSKSSISKIFVGQKKAVRAVAKGFNRCYYDKDTGELPCHTKSLFIENKILTVHNLITKNCATAMHKVYLDAAPAAISRIFTINENINRSCRRDPDFFAIHRTRLTNSDKSLSAKGPKLYNKMINDLRHKNFALYPEQLALLPFKARIVNYLLDIQKNNEGNSWDLNIFPLYSS